MRIAYQSTSIWCMCMTICRYICLQLCMDTHFGIIQFCVNIRLNLLRNRLLLTLVLLFCLSKAYIHYHRFNYLKCTMNTIFIYTARTSACSSPAYIHFLLILWRNYNGLSVVFGDADKEKNNKINNSNWNWNLNLKFNSLSLHEIRFLCGLHAPQNNSLFKYESSRQYLYTCISSSAIPQNIVLTYDSKNNTYGIKPYVRS